SPSSNRTCSSPAYGFPIIFTSRHARAPIRGVLWNGIETKLFVEFSRWPPAKSKPLNLSSPLQVLAHPLLQEKALPHKHARRVVQVKIIHPSPHIEDERNCRDPGAFHAHRRDPQIRDDARARRGKHHGTCPLRYSNRSCRALARRAVQTSCVARFLVP